MIQETIKKIKFFIIPLLLSAVLIFVPSAEASSANITLTNNMPGSITLVLVEQSSDSNNIDDPNYNGYINATYEGTLTYGMVGFTLHNYFSGRFISYGSVSVDNSVFTGTNLTISQQSISLTYEKNDDYLHYFYPRYWSASPYTVRYDLYTYLDNFYSYGTSNGYSVGNIKVRYTASFTVSNQTNGNPFIPTRVQASIEDRGTNISNLVQSTEPNTGVTYNLLTTAIQDVMDIYTDSSGYLTVSDEQVQDLLDLIYSRLGVIDSDINDVELSIEEFQTDAMPYLEYLAYMDDLYNNLLTLRLSLGFSPSTDTLKQYLNFMIIQLTARINELKEALVGNSESQAESMENAAEAVESKMDAVNNYTQPNVNYMLDEANVIWVSGASGQNLIATITNKPYYVMILLGVVSLGFVGYLLYGKGV